MGQKMSTMNIVLDQVKVFPGDELSGYVSIDPPVGSSMEGMSLEIRVRGVEKSICAVQTTSTIDDRHSSSPHIAYEMREVLSSVYTLKDYENDLIDKNRKLFSFCIILPNNLPPTFTTTLHGSSGGECSISYGLECLLFNPFIRQEEPLEQTFIEFIVSERKSSSSSLINEIISFPIYRLPKFYDLYFCNLWKVGEIIIGIYCPTCVLYLNQGFDLTYLIQKKRENSTNVDIRAIELTLNEVVSWTAQSVKREKQNVLYQTRIERENIQFIDEIPLALHPNHSSLHDHEEQEETIVKEWERVSQQQQQQQQQRPQSNTIKVVVPCHDSIKGNLRTKFIEVKYFFHLKVCTQIGTNNPTVQLPVFVQTSSPVSSQSLNAMASTQEAVTILPSSMNGIDIARFFHSYDENTFMLNDYVVSADADTTSSSLIP